MHKERHSIMKYVDSAFDIGRWNLYGIMFKYFARVLPLDKITQSCTVKTGADFLCSLTSNDSAPNALQSFFATIGMSLAMNRLFPKLNTKQLIVATASAMLGFIFLGEILPTITKGIPFNWSDITTETIGMIPSLFLTTRMHRDRNSQGIIT